MKKLLVFLASFMLCMSAVMAGPVSQVTIVGGEGQSPIYTESQFTPLVFLNQNGGRILFNDMYYNNGDITERDNNYAFTGEQIQWKVLVWDKNGVPEKIEDVFAGWVNQTNGPSDPEIQVNCQSLGPVSGNLVDKGYPNVRRPGDQISESTGNPNTMGEYLCTLTIEQNCHGQKWMGVKAVDLSGLSSTMREAESWFCNPELDLTVSGNIDFGILGPGEQGSSTFSVENSGETGSGVEVVLAISGTDFYDPTPSGGMCPYTNQMSLRGTCAEIFDDGFWYTAVQGANIVSEKRIPYGDSIVEADPVFSSGLGVTPNWAGTLVPMSPGTEASITMHLGIPQPCNGEFTNGNIYLYSWAI